MAIYATKADVERIFGPDNVRQWSQLDPNQATADDAAIARAIDVATQILLAMMEAPPVNAVTTRWVATMAGFELYQARGATSDDFERYRSFVTDVRAEIAQYLAGVRRFPGITPTDAPDLVVE